MDELFGLPAHPLLVHAPVVLLPLAALGVLVTLVRANWYLRYRWAVLAVGLVGALGAILAASSGEELEHQVERGAGEGVERLIEAHAEAGDTARDVAIVFAIALLAYVLVPWFLERRSAASTTTAEAGEGGTVDSRIGGSDRVGGPGWLRPVLMVLVTVTAAGSVYTVVDAGHKGAEAVWAGESGEGG